MAGKQHRLFMLLMLFPFRQPDEHPQAEKTLVSMQADTTGTIVKFLTENGAPVTPGQVCMFKASVWQQLLHLQSQVSAV